MSLPSRIKQRRAEDRAFEQKTRIRHSDPTAERFTGGNVYSSAEIEAIEAEKLRFWRRRRR